MLKSDWRKTVQRLHHSGVCMTAAFSTRMSSLEPPRFALKSSAKLRMDRKDAKSSGRIVMSGLGPASGLPNRMTYI